MNRSPILATALAFALTASGSARADRDHERAREALERGDVLPLAVILERVATRIDGVVLEVELDRERGRFVYELEIVDAGGRLLEVEVDAATGEILRWERD